jgi:hypothetical protein
MYDIVLCYARYYIDLSKFCDERFNRRINGLYYTKRLGTICAKPFCYEKYCIMDLCYCARRVLVITTGTQILTGQHSPSATIIGQQPPVGHVEFDAVKV